MSEDSDLPELTEAARRAGSIVNDEINSIVDVVQRQADEIRRSAEDDARATRHEAMESAQRVLERINALEQPLGELVQTLRVEMDRVGRELEGPVAVEATAIPAPPESPAEATPLSGGASVAEVVAAPERQAPPEPQQQPTSDPEPVREKESPFEDEKDEAASQHEPAPAATEQSGHEDGTLTEDAPADQPQPILHSPTDLEPEKKSGRFRFRLKGTRGKGTFITSQGHCAVCQKTFMAGTEENLRLSGWKVSEDVGACPECQADGWQLPDGARLPFRRGGS